MQQHRRSDANRRTVYRGDERLRRMAYHPQKTEAWTLLVVRRIGEKILQVIAGAERVPRAMQKHDAHRPVPLCRGDRLGDRRVHLDCHRVPLLRSIELNALNRAFARGGDVVHGHGPTC